MLHQEPSSVPVAKLLKTLHLVEELNEYAKEGYFLHTCSFEQLCDLAQKTSAAFRSTSSAYMALSPNAEHGRAHFQKYIDPLLDAHFPAPRSSPFPATQKKARSASEGSNSDDDSSDDIDEEIAIADVMEIGFEDETVQTEMSKDASGNILFHNNILLWRDLLQYWEFKHSVKEGDMGHMFEVIKVSGSFRYHVKSLKRCCSGSEFGFMVLEQATMATSFYIKC